MYAQTAPLPRSVWADLDALVLEEFDAIQAELAPPRPRREFDSDEDFVIRAIAYLVGHADPAALMERIASGFPSPPESDGEPSVASASGIGERTTPHQADSRDNGPDGSREFGEEEREGRQS